jgi:hypothetical protein
MKISTRIISVFVLIVQGQDDVELLSGTEVTIRASAHTQVVARMSEPRLIT